MKSALLAGCCLALCSLTALAQKAPMTDQDFLNFAAQTDMVEAHLGDLAQSVATSQQVKDYGRMLTADHTRDYAVLKNLAQQTGLNLPAAIDGAHNKSTIGPYHQLKGPGFDRKYIQDMIAGHAEAIATYTEEAHEAQDPSIRSYAQDTLPTLKKHLDAARDLAQHKSPSM